MGRAAPPGHHGRAEGRYMPKAGEASSSARHHRMYARARARADEFGRLLYACAYEKELDRPVTEPLAELPGVRFGVEGRLLSMSTYMQKFPANPGVGRDIRLIGQPLAA